MIMRLPAYSWSMIFFRKPVSTFRDHALWTLVALLCALLVPSNDTRAQEAITTVGNVQDKIVISGGVDVVGLNGLDVVLIVPDRMLMDHISDPLVRTGRDGKLQPWLATSWKSIDPLTWELTLRRGVKYQNGEPFDARSVKFFYDTMNDPKNISPSKSNHTWVARVDIVDDHTVRVVTREPYPVAPGKFTLTHMFPPDYVTKVGYDGYRKKPIGTGPYRLIEYVRDDHVTLEAFDGWWAGKPKIKTIVYRPIKEDSARVSGLLAGEIDLAFDVPPELMPLVERAGKTKIKRALSVRTFFLFLNTINAAYPTTKREVREAINYAIDRESLNKNILGSTGAPAAWLNPNTFGINPALKPIPHDPARAKQLLAQAGYPDGVDLVLDAFQGRFIKDKELAEAIAGQLTQAGIRTKVQIHEWGVFAKRMWSHQSNPLALLAWVDNVGDPDVQNYRVLQTGGTWSQNSDPGLDELIKAIASEMDPEKRKALIMRQQDYMRQSFPIAYLLQIGIIAGVSGKLDWWEPAVNDAHRFYRLSGSN
jgi:peptide/nickel transport system substrate-binding protein